MKVRILFCTPVFSDFYTFRAFQGKHYKGHALRERTNSDPRKITEMGGRAQLFRLYSHQKSFRVPSRPCATHTSAYERAESGHSKLAYAH